VESGGTAIGIKCKDGVVLAVEKLITSKLLKPGANKRIGTVDRHVGIVSPSEFVFVRDGELLGIYALLLTLCCRRYPPD
jgi:hypothetical protein